MIVLSLLVLNPSSVFKLSEMSVAWEAVSCCAYASVDFPVSGLTTLTALVRNKTTL